MKTILTPEVERLILEKVQTGRYGTADEVVLRGLSLLQREETTLDLNPEQAGDAAALFASASAEVPAADWQEVPTDLSVNVDHYLYHSQKY